MKLSDFDYYLPKELIAQYPLKIRDVSRMMVLDRAKRRLKDKRFKDIISYMRKGDTIVLNNSKVIPARIACRRETGGKAEIFLLEKIKKNLYEAMIRPASKLFPGKRLVCEDGRPIAEVVKNREVGKLIRFADITDVEKELDRIGRIPLPPYIKRAPDAADKDRYQTVYAVKDGSTASPTAGLHFTKDTLKKIEAKGINIAYITLHVGYGTFAPVRASDIEKHKMHREKFELSKAAQNLIEMTKRKKARVVAVGTTAVRVLEDNKDAILSGCKRDIMGWTNLFIYPPYKFDIVDMLLTNFHLPRSTLLMLTGAFAGMDFMMKAYNEAVRRRYRFCSYGDCMLII